MDEVKDILKDCLEKIDRISSNSATEQSSHVELNPASADQRSTEQVVRRAEANFRYLLTRQSKFHALKKCPRFLKA